MSEAIWIELIKVLPAFLWVVFGFILLAVAKRIFTAQAPRMTKVETPWVTVELAQQAIEQAAERGPVPPPVEPDWSQLYPPLPSQQVGAGFGQPVVPGGADDDDWGFLDSDAEDESSAGLESGNSAARLGPPVSRPEKANSQNTPPADGPSDNSVTQDDERSDDLPLSPVTEPNLQVPNVPPTYPILAAPPGNAGGYYAPPIRRRPNSMAASAPLPPYGQPHPTQADTQRGLRSATRLALSADLLQGGAILWVDDHQQWNEPLIRLFRTAGIIVDAVASTDEAMRAFKDRSYDLVITDMRRELEPDGDNAGMLLLDRMIAAGIPTPAVFFSDHPNAHTAVHPRAVTTTNSPEKLVDTVVDIVGTRRSQQSSNSGTSWLDRLKG
jgi:hypothetical protein